MNAKKLALAKAHLTRTEMGTEAERLVGTRYALWQIIEAFEAPDSVPMHGADRHNQFDPQYAPAAHGHIREEVG